MVWILIVAVLVGAIHAFCSRMQATTLWAGRLLAPAGAEASLPQGLQDAITPPWLTRLNIAWMLGLAAVLIGGTIVRCYLGVVGVIAVVVSGWAWQAVLSKNLTTYLRFVANSLAQREDDYRKNGDEDRAGAAHDFFIGVAGLLETSAAKSLQVPSVREALNTPLGQVGL